MGVTRIPPLEKADWFARLVDLSVSCFLSFEDEQEAPIRQMRHLLRDAPNTLWTFGLLVPEEVYFECMLAARDYEAAARSLFSCEAALMLARDDQGQYLATVILPGGQQAEASADSTGLALVGALASALAQGRLALSALNPPPSGLRKAA
jgi:hypothetical protein